MFKVYMSCIVSEQTAFFFYLCDWFYKPKWEVLPARYEVNIQINYKLVLTFNTLEYPPGE
jgi:hypothetical protein